MVDFIPEIFNNVIETSPLTTYEVTYNTSIVASTQKEEVRNPRFYEPSLRTSFEPFIINRRQYNRLRQFFIDVGGTRDYFLFDARINNKASLIPEDLGDFRIRGRLIRISPNTYAPVQQFEWVGFYTVTQTLRHIKSIEVDLPGVQVQSFDPVTGDTVLNTDSPVEIDAEIEFYYPARFDSDRISAQRLQGDNFEISGLSLLEHVSPRRNFASPEEFGLTLFGDVTPPFFPELQEDLYLSNFLDTVDAGIEARTQRTDARREEIRLDEFPFGGRAQMRYYLAWFYTMRGRFGQFNLRTQDGAFYGLRRFSDDTLSIRHEVQRREDTALKAAFTAFGGGDYEAFSIQELGFTTVTPSPRQVAALAGEERRLSLARYLQERLQVNFLALTDAEDFGRIV